MGKKLMWIFLIAAIAIGIMMKDRIYPMLFYFSKTSNQQSMSYFFDRSMSLEELADDLVSEKILDSKTAFLILGEYKNLNKEKLALGKYNIEPGTSIRQLLNGFTKNARGNGNAEEEIEIVIGNARFVADLVGKIEKKLLLDSATLLQELNSPVLLDELGLNNRQTHCLLLPNTYRFYYDTDEKAFLNRMKDEYKLFWNTERKEKLKQVGLNTPAEAITLASIVYSEQNKVKEEWSVIAGLYLNRIRIGIPLQSDPTFKYCWGKELDTVQRLMAVHRNIKCDYNTYFIQGLPPGPICIPPLEVVDAVLNRSEHDYLYMVALPEYSGKHYFSTNYEDHQREARVFQRWLGEELKN
jgi:UPF0755 protein